MNKSVTPVLDAFLRAGKYALIFAAGLFLFFFSTIALVQGDGNAPKITYVTVAILEFTEKLLGISGNGSVFPVTLFWAAIFFVLVFVWQLAWRSARTR